MTADCCLLANVAHYHKAFSTPADITVERFVNHKREKGSALIIKAADEDLAAAWEQTCDLYVAGYYLRLLKPLLISPSLLHLSSLYSPPPSPHVFLSALAGKLPTELILIRFIRIHV